MNKLIQLYDQYLQSNKNDTSFIDFFSPSTNLVYIERHINEPRKEDRQTLLHLAVINNDIKSVILLLQHKADVTVADKWGKTPLYRALEGEKIQLEIVKKLIEHGANINEKDPLRATALHWSVLAGNLQKTDTLLSLGADINSVNRNLETPLRWALTRDLHKSEDHIQQKMVLLLFRKSPVISQDFTGIKVSPGLTDNIIVIGSTKLKDISPIMENITRLVRGFEKAITSIEEFDEAVKEGIAFNYELIEKATMNSTIPEVIKLHERAKFYRMANEGTGIPEIKHNLVRNIVLLWLLADPSTRKAIERKILTLPNDIQDLVIDESIENYQKIPELRPTLVHSLAELWTMSNEPNKKYIELKISTSPQGDDFLNLFNEDKKLILELKSQKKSRAA